MFRLLLRWDDEVSVFEHFRMRHLPHAVTTVQEKEFVMIVMCCGLLVVCDA